MGVQSQTTDHTARDMPGSSKLHASLEIKCLRGQRKLFDTFQFRLPEEATRSGFQAKSYLQQGNSTSEERPNTILTSRSIHLIPLQGFVRLIPSYLAVPICKHVRSRVVRRLYELVPGGGSPCSQRGQNKVVGILTIPTLNNVLPPPPPPTVRFKDKLFQRPLQT